MSKDLKEMMVFFNENPRHLQLAKQIVAMPKEKREKALKLIDAWTKGKANSIC